MSFLAVNLGYLSVLSVCVGVSASVDSLILQWVVLEVNMLSVIPVLMGGQSGSGAYTSAGYFISQSCASLVFIFSLVLGLEKSGALALTMFSLLFKLGMPPFHSWVMNVLPGLSLSSAVVVFTVQKFTPLVVLSHTGLGLWWLAVVMAASLVVLLVSAERVVSVYTVLFLSSVSNGMWLLSLVSFGGGWVMYLWVYSFMVASLVFTLKSMGLFSIGHMSGLPVWGGLALALQLLNLGGLPPFLGFFVKVVALKSLVVAGWVGAVVLLLSAFMVLIVYTLLVFTWGCLPPAGRNLSLSLASGWGALLVGTFTAGVSGGVWFMA